MSSNVAAASVSSAESERPLIRQATAKSLIANDEIEQIIEFCRETSQAGRIAGNRSNKAVRRSRVTWLRRREGFGWVYERLWPTVEKLNNQLFDFDIDDFDGSVQIARYTETDQGHYGWHMDNGKHNSGRKISISMQLSDPESYAGGDLDLFYSHQPIRAERAKGTVVAFPSFVMHRVTPVTRGERYSLVAWIKGPKWR